MSTGGNVIDYGDVRRIYQGELPIIRRYVGTTLLWDSGLRDDGLPPVAPPPPDPPPPDPGSGGFLREITVGSYTQLQQAAQNAQPGDDIIVEDGTYSGSRITMTALGTSANPIRVRGRNLLQANLLCGMALLGDYTQLYGIRHERSAEATAFMIGGNYNSIWRSRFHTLGGSNIQLLTGQYGEVMFSEFSSPSPDDHTQASTFCIRTQHGSDYNHTNGRIGYCYFHDLPSKYPDPADYHLRARVGVGIAHNHTRSRITTTFLVDHCLFERTGECELSIKTIGNRALYVTMKDSNANLNQRFGGSNRYEGCWSENCRAPLIMGDNHVLNGCKVVNSGGIEVFMGNQESETVAGGYPRAKNVKLIGCEGPVTVGQKWTTNPPMTYPALNTRLEAHVGTINEKSGNHSGTVISATPSETIVAPVRMSASQVGPLAATS